MNATQLRNAIETAAKRPTSASIAKAIAAIEKSSKLLSANEQTELVSEFQRNAELIADCGCVSWDGLDDCVQIAIKVERRSLVVELGKADPSDEMRTRHFVARLNGVEVSGEVFRCWYRVGGTGWAAQLRRLDGSKPPTNVFTTHRTIDAAIRNAIHMTSPCGSSRDSV